VIARYYGQGELKNGQAYYYAQDQVGSVVALVDAAGHVAGRVGYDPYGNVISSTGTLPDYRYAGLYGHDPSGLFLATYRAYDPAVGRWLNRDPIGLAGGLNLYAYANNNPLRWTDPTGLDVFLCRRPADLPFPLNQFDHYWIKTDTYEAGMGGMRGGVPGQNGNSDRPYDPTQTVDHSGQSKASNASCEKQRNVDEQCVNDLIQPGQSTGGWNPYNQCQSFAFSAINRCRTGPQIPPSK
jgi:RHS repeat-associated protein